tara:strand:- start:169 stop:363 length:195 start_codon:yes stop_codon:yes gene_type:complete
MKTYNVLMTINQYVEVQANSAFEAANTAHEEFREGKHEIDQYPEFFCEECDAEDCEDDEEEDTE